MNEKRIEVSEMQFFCRNYKETVKKEAAEILGTPNEERRLGEFSTHKVHEDKISNRKQYTLIEEQVSQRDRSVIKDIVLLRTTKGWKLWITMITYILKQAPKGQRMLALF